MSSQTITAGRRPPITAAAIVIAFVAIVTILALQGAALVSTSTSRPVVGQQGTTDVSSSWNVGPSCQYRSSRTPLRSCASGSADATGSAPHTPTLREMLEHK